MVQATLRFCTNRRTGLQAWHAGIDADDGDHHEFVIEDVALDIANMISNYGLGRGTVDIREDEASSNVEAVLAATGRAARSLARYSDPKITAIQEG
jgi:hypothetical protein